MVAYYIGGSTQHACYVGVNNEGIRASGHWPFLMRVCDSQRVENHRARMDIYKSQTAGPPDSVLLNRISNM